MPADREKSNLVGDAVTTRAGVRYGGFEGGLVAVPQGAAADAIHHTPAGPEEV
jgi:hypothetical protein